MWNPLTLMMAIIFSQGELKLNQISFIPSYKTFYDMITACLGHVVSAAVTLDRQNSKEVSWWLY